MPEIQLLQVAMDTKELKVNLKDELQGEIKGSTPYVESKVQVFSVTRTLLTMATLKWSLTGTLELCQREILSYRANSLKQPNFAELVVFNSEAAEKSPGTSRAGS